MGASVRWYGESQDDLKLYIIVSKTVLIRDLYTIVLLG